MTDRSSGSIWSRGHCHLGTPSLIILESFSYHPCHHLIIWLSDLSLIILIYHPLIYPDDQINQMISDISGHADIATSWVTWPCRRPRWSSGLSLIILVYDPHIYKDDQMIWYIWSPGHCWTTWASPRWSLSLTLIILAYHHLISDHPYMSSSDLWSSLCHPQIYATSYLLGDMGVPSMFIWSYSIGRSAFATHYTSSKRWSLHHPLIWMNMEMEMCLADYCTLMLIHIFWSYYIFSHKHMIIW